MGLLNQSELEKALAHIRQEYQSDLAKSQEVNAIRMANAAHNPPCVRLVVASLFQGG